MLDIQKFVHPQHGEGVAYTMPNGRRAFVSFSKYSEDEAKQVILKDWGADLNYNTVATQPNPFGLADEVSGAGAAIVNSIAGKGDFLSNLTEGYTEGRDQYRAAEEVFNFFNPKLGTLRTGAGIVAGVGGPAGMGRAFGPIATGQTSLAGDVAVAAGEGALTGFGESEGGVAEAVVGAGTGALAGAVLGGVFGTLSRKITSFAQYVRKLKARGADAARTRKLEQQLLRLMQEEGIGPDRIAARMRMLGDDAMLLDAGSPNGPIADAAKTAARTSPAARNTIESRLYRRAAGQSDRVLDTLSDALGTEQIPLARILDEQTSPLKEAARPIYQQLDTFLIDSSDELVDLAGNKLIARAYPKARELAQAEGRILPTKLKDAIKDGQLTLRDWDYIKQGVDSVVFKDRRAGEAPNMLSAYRNLRTRLVDELDRQATVDGENLYKQARDLWAGAMRLQESAELGRRFARASDPELTAEALRGMTDVERQVYRQGVTQALVDIIDNVPDGRDVVRKIFGKKALRDRIQSAFPDRASFLAFQKQMIGEGVKGQRKAFITGGSDTAANLSSMQQMEADLADFGITLAFGNMTDLAATAARRLTGGIKRADPEDAKELARMMIMRGRDAEQIARQAEMRGFDQGIQSLIGRPVAAATGAYGGLFGPQLLGNEEGNR